MLKAQPKLLNSVLPRLASPPLTAFSAQTLGALAEVLGAALSPYLPLLVPPLLSACSSEVRVVRLRSHTALVLRMSVSQASDIAAAARAATEAVLLSVGESSASDVVRELQRGFDDDSAGCRAATASLAGFYFKSQQAELEEHVPAVLGAKCSARCYGRNMADLCMPQTTAALILQLADPDAAAVQAAWAALGDVTSALPKDSMHIYVRCVRDAVSSARDKARAAASMRYAAAKLQLGPQARRRNRTKEADTLIAGFCLPKGLSHVLPIYLQAVLTGGGTEAREAAADAIGELVAVTSEESLKPHVITITGPLIRVISDKFQWQVKAAILQTLTLLIAKGGQTLKPFVPQLQTTFVKCLQDAARTVRMRAATALGLLMQLQTRLDPLCTELLNSLQAADTDAGVREALTVALRDVVTQGGAHITPPVLERIISTLQQDIPGQDVELQVSRAGALAAALKFSTQADFDALVGALAVGTGDARFRAAALCAVAELAAARVHGSSVAARLNDAACSLAVDGHADVRALAVRCIGLLVDHMIAAGSLPAAGLIERLVLSVADEASDVRRCALVVIKQMAKRQPPALSPTLLSAAADAMNDRVAPVKLAAERAVRAACFTPDAGLEGAQAVVNAAGGTLRSKLTDVVLRRLSKLDDADD